MVNIEHTEDVATLKELLRVYATENARLHKRLQELVHENAKLQGKGPQEQMKLELSRLEEQMNAPCRSGCLVIRRSVEKAKVKVKARTIIVQSRSPGDTDLGRSPTLSISRS